MVKTLCLCLAVVGSTEMAASQGALVNPSVLLSQDGPGGINVLLGARQEGFYLGDPAVSVTAQAINGKTLMASRFAIRAWQEGDGTKVVVYAVVPSEKAPIRELEVPIAMHVLRQSAHIRVTETGTWGAAPVVLRLVRPLRR